MSRTARHLRQEVCTANHFIKACEAEVSEDFTDFFSDEAHQVHNLVRRAGELRTEVVALCTYADRAGVGVTLANHDTAHRDQRECANAVFLSAQHSRHDNVTACTQATICTQGDLIAQIVE